MNCFCIQKEDLLFNEYVDLFKSHKIRNYFISESMPTSYLWNQMATKGELLTPETMLLLKQKLDKKIEDEANKFKDNIFVITIDDGRE